MLNINKELNETNLTVKLEGRLDTTSAPMLDDEVKASVNGITKLVFDLSSVEYVSSAGLRVLLAAQKIMNRQGEMIITGANEVLMEIFEVTGFVDILTIE